MLLVVVAAPGSFVLFYVSFFTFRCFCVSPPDDTHKLAGVTHQIQMREGPGIQGLFKSASIFCAWPGSDARAGLSSIALLPSRSWAADTRTKWGAGDGRQDSDSGLVSGLAGVESLTNLWRFLPKDFARLPLASRVQRFITLFLSFHRAKHKKNQRPTIKKDSSVQFSVSFRFGHGRTSFNPCCIPRRFYFV